MTSRILGLIGVLWGGAILFWRFTSEAAPSANPSYRTGQTAAMVFAGFLVVVGAYYLFRPSRG
jgi:hypothetical protein